MLSRRWLQVLWMAVPQIACQTITSTTSAPQPTICGDIINSGDIVFSAKQAYDCLTSVPFNPAVASRFVQYYNDTIQFHSTLAYLKRPPSSYQQPGVDLVAGLAQLQADIDNNRFGNQYDFEVALQKLIFAAHDNHLQLVAGALAVFSFASPRDIISVSLDGISPPQVYLFNDWVDSNAFTAFQPSPITIINGEDAMTYLSQFAANQSYGMVEPHAEWNQLMESAALDILGYLDIFSGGASFYPGDTITFELENGTIINDEYKAIYWSQGPTGPLETGGDFYNFFVLGFYPASYNPDDNGSTTSAADVAISSTATATATASPLSWDNLAYPKIPDIAQPDLGVYGGGYVSGYFLNETSIAVLSIPSFDEYGPAINTFQSTVQEFIDRSHEAGLEKIVIDLQWNQGGQPLLAIDTFQRFFPNATPFSGSRMRSHRAADVMGRTETDFWSNLSLNDPWYTALAANEWIIKTRINAETGQNFSSWPEYFGPNTYVGDEFSNVQRYNVSNSVFTTDAVEETTNWTVAVPQAGKPERFSADNIILLTDGICGSSCSLFAEMMHHEAGVRVVTVGGRPVTGPMQIASGSRGAQEYSLDALDGNIELVQEILLHYGSTNATFLPNRTEANDVFIVSAAINLRDQIRRGETTPLQFAYEAADCRIYYTPQTVYNYTNLWQYAADAVWNNPNHCVANSTGYSTIGSNTTDFVGPWPNSSPTTTLYAASSVNSSTVPYSGLLPSDLLTAGLNLRTLNSGVCPSPPECGQKLSLSKWEGQLGWEPGLTEK
ncbi:hypothetical protein AAE478_001931 [Parahypoxylon ruwenzoriense]